MLESYAVKFVKNELCIPIHVTNQKTESYGKFSIKMVLTNPNPVYASSSDYVKLMNTSAAKDIVCASNRDVVLTAKLNNGSSKLKSKSRLFFFQSQHTPLTNIYKQVT